jgi:glycyl-tRNA synthetase (class II)
VTVDRETLEQGTVTVRVRDSKQQEKVKVAELSGWLKSRLV